MSFTIVETNKFKILKPCIDQDTKERLEPGGVHSFKSDFERGRHLAEGNITPVDDTEIERAVSEPAETRTRRKRKKTS